MDRILQSKTLEGIFNMSAVNDVGAVNAMVSASVPPLGPSIPQGVSVALTVKNTNTGPATYDAGSGPAPVLGATGAPLVGGELVAGSTYTMTVKGPNWVFASPSGAVAPTAAERDAPARRDAAARRP